MQSLPPLVLAVTPWGDGGQAFGWFWPIIPLLWIVVIGLVVWLVARRRPTGPDPLDRARETLADRYARGELTTEEYRERADRLR